MRCDELHRLSHRLAAGRLSEAERAAVDRHTATCLECRELVTLAGRDGGGSAREIDLVAAVLAQTGADPCASARERLCARVDDELDALDTELVDAHRTGCVECEGLASSLIAMRAELPMLADVDPGPAFTAAVLSRTTAVPVAAPTPGERLVSWLTEPGRLWQRPRLAMEAAYVLTLLVTVLVITPGSPLADVPSHALNLTRARPAIDLRQPTARLELEVKQNALALWEPLDGATRELASSTARVSGEFTNRIRQHVGTFAAQLASKTTTTDSAEPANESHGDDE